MAVLRRAARLLQLLGAALAVLRLASALAAFVLILLPAEVWSEPAEDLSAEGFDSETVYVDDSGGHYRIAPFQVLVNGAWRPCPCPSASRLVLLGSDLSPITLSHREGATSLGGVSVRVDGKPTQVYAVSPGQVNFFLPAEAAAPVSTIQLLRDGREIGRQTIRVKEASPATSETAVVTIDRSRLRLWAPPATQPSVHLLTSPLSFRASFDVVVEQSASGQPFEAMVWNPRNFGAVSLEFGPPPDLRVTAMVRESRGEPTVRRDLGRYELGAPYRLQIELERGNRLDLRLGPRGDQRSQREVTFTPSDAPALFDAYRPSLTVLSQSVTGTSAVALSNYRLELPHQRFLTSRADDAKILPLVVSLLVLSALLHAPLLISGVRKAGAASLRPRPAVLASAFRHHWWLVPALVGLGSAAGFLVTLGSHPFDMASQKIWTYLLVREGIADFYYRAQTVPIAAIWNGMPFHEAVYPYGVGMSYYFSAVGWTYRLLGGEVAPNSAGLEIAIKAANLLVACADAALLFALARGLGRHRFALLIPAAFLLNPAVLFDVTIWGETESVGLFFLLASLLAAQRGSSGWAWALLGLAFLGKQTIVLPALLAGIYYLRLFPLRRTLDGLGLAMPVVLVAILPYIVAGYPPSIAIDPILGTFRVFGGSEMEELFQVVSFDTYSIWPLVTLFWHGQHGLDRLQFSDSASYLGPLSYHQVGVLAFLTLVGALALWLLTSRRIDKEPGLIFLVLAFATLAELLLPTRAIARYLVFPLILALLASCTAPARTTWFVIGVLTLTSLIGMYGSVASGIESMPSLAPRLAPSNNDVSATMLRLFRSDTMITVGSLLNLAALLVLAITIWRPQGVAVRIPASLPPPSRAEVLAK